MAQDDLIARLLAQREQWCDLAPGQRVRVRRPGETDIGRFARGISVADAAGCCVSWEGFSAATILGPSLGSDKPVPFDAALWVELLRDNIAWYDKVVADLVAMISAHLDARDVARKNSLPSLTPGPALSSRASDQPTQAPAS
jgi:hypothetical protein